MGKKLYPQIVTNLPVLVSNQDGFSLETRTIGTSDRDMALQCKTEERDLVSPGGSLLRDGRPIELLVRLHIPNGQDGTAQVSARCHLTYSRRLAKDICQLGLRYLEFENDGGDRLAHFIESRLAANCV